MKFYLVDRIESLSLDRSKNPPTGRIETVKALSLAEEYLADHFPAFPVLPGVMMLEALVQSAAWLVRVAQDFSTSVIELKAARNVRYASFVSPGQSLRCQVEAMEIGPELSKFKAAGYVGDTQTVSARIELRSFNLAPRGAHLADADKAILAQMRQRFELVHGPAAMKAAGLA